MKIFGKRKSKPNVEDLLQRFADILPQREFPDEIPLDDLLSIPIIDLVGSSVRLKNDDSERLKIGILNIGLEVTSRQELRIGYVFSEDFDLNLFELADESVSEGGSARLIAAAGINQGMAIALVGMSQNLKEPGFINRDLIIGAFKATAVLSDSAGWVDDEFHFFWRAAIVAYQIARMDLERFDNQ